MIITETIKKNDTWEIDVFKKKNLWTYWTYKNALIKEITNIFNISNQLSLNTNDYINIKNLLKNAKFKLLENVAEYEKGHEIRILKFIQYFLPDHYYSLRLEVIDDLIKECESQTLIF